MGATINRPDPPRSAARLYAGHVRLSSVDPAKPAAIAMLARTGQPLAHWFWGMLVHDMDGMKLEAARLPVDYCHEEECGYLDKFEVDGEFNLRVAGMLVPTSAPEDIARKIIERRRGGVPYEASIYFDPEDLVAEEVAERQTARVNGYLFTGPGIILREWTLKAVAVCPHGYDRDTETELVEVASELAAPLRRRAGGSPVK